MTEPAQHEEDPRAALRDALRRLTNRERQAYRWGTVLVVVMVVAGLVVPLLIVASVLTGLSAYLAAAGTVPPGLLAVALWRRVGLSMKRRGVLTDAPSLKLRAAFFSFRTGAVAFGAFVFVLTLLDALLRQHLGAGWSFLSALVGALFAILIADAVLEDRSGRSKAKRSEP
jgi:uncharacterized membrane protein